MSSETQQTISMAVVEEIRERNAAEMQSSLEEPFSLAPTWRTTFSIVLIPLVAIGDLMARPFKAFYNRYLWAPTSEEIQSGGGPSPR